MDRQAVAALPVLLSLVGHLGACRPNGESPPSATSAFATASGAALTPSPSAPSPLESYAASELETRPVELLKLQFTSGVKNRDPVDKLAAAHPGDVVYAHVTVRNRTGRPRKVHLAFSVNGKERTVLDLDVAESWSYRTWGRDTVKKTDKPGELTLSITDDEGNPLADEKIPILAR